MSIFIGIAPDTFAGDCGDVYTRVPYETIGYLWDTYQRPLLDFGAVPVVLPVTRDKQKIKDMADKMDGFLIAGGNFDVPPSYYGQEPKPWLGTIKKERSDFELAILEEALERDMPLLGICGGLQLINVAFGGTLLQDILKERPESRDHQQKVKRDRTSHEVKTVPGTLFHRIVTGGNGETPKRLRVNSTHHQAADQVPDSIAVAARATDGLVEALESKSHRFVVGVQWHPELLYKTRPAHANIFRAFLEAAKK